MMCNSVYTIAGGLPCIIQCQRCRMNKDRRKSIQKISEKLESLKGEAEALWAEIETIQEEIESVRDEEQEYFDAMPESLQGGDRGQAAEEAVTNLDTAKEALDDIEEVATSIQAAIDALENAAE